MRPSNPFVVLACVVGFIFALATPAAATFPYPSGGDPYDYTRLHIENGDCDPQSPDLPNGFDCKEDFKLADSQPQPGDEDYDPSVESNPQELFGVRGPGTNHAWEVTTGRPDTIIAVEDSGIRWSENTPELVNKFYLNAGELPIPEGACSAPAPHPHDCNGDGVFNVQDYAGDPRVSDLDDSQAGIGPGNTYVDPADLIRLFSNGVDDDHNGYTDDISGWDFFEQDNNPGDDVSFDHGTGESGDSAAEIEKQVTQCPNCMLMELRVGDSFIADINAFAQGVVYAVDNGASLVQEALGTVNHTAFGKAAVDYAYANGVLIVASEADESAGHHNYPAALNHTMVVNSVTPVPTGVFPHTFLAFNGCTNFGGYTWLSVESTSCSSDATGQSAGMAGLLYSAARNFNELHPAEARWVSGRPLSAEEAKQLLRAVADDIDFATAKPPGPPNNFATGIPVSQRFVTTPGLDQISGWGRLNIDEAVHLAAEGHIPPEADLTSPRWWQPLPTSGTVNVLGRVAAPRASSYTYEVQFAPGVQPTATSGTDGPWTTVASGSGSAPKEGVLATLDLGQVRAAIDGNPPPYSAPPFTDPTSPDHPEKDAFRVRVVVHDDRDDTPDAIEQRQYFSVADPSLLPAFPRYLNADGAGSPAFADIDRDSRDELVIGDGNGFLHAFKANGTEAKGWPAHTNPVELPTTGTNAYTTGKVPKTVYTPLGLGSPVVANLNGSGPLEVAATAGDGNLYVWNWRGNVVDGFPVSVNRNYSSEPGCQTTIGPNCDDWSNRDVRDPLNTTYGAFTSMPAAGGLDPAAKGLELVAGASDMHVYAWHADGTPVPGWPVMLGDPSKIASVDPVTHRVTYAPGSGALRGRKIITGVSLGDVDGDGRLEVAVNANEEYDETPNWSRARDPGLGTLEAAVRAADEHPGNTRVYLLYRDGTQHPAHNGSGGTANPDDQAYVSGWPVKIGMLITELLPDVGEGSNGAPVMADVDDDGELEIGTASMAGPPYLLRADGADFYPCCPDGYATMTTSHFQSSQTDEPSLAALGGGVFGRLGGEGSSPSFAMGAAGLKRLLDVVFPEQQLGAEDHVSAWNVQTGEFELGFPASMNDLQFFNTPAIADVSGDGRAEVLEGSAMYDVRAYSLGGGVPSSWPKFTGGWLVDTPGTGDLNGDGKLDVAAMTREGYLYVWSTQADACQTAEWPKYQHDLWNTGNYSGSAPTRSANCGSQD